MPTADRGEYKVTVFLPFHWVFLEGKREKEKEKEKEKERDCGNSCTFQCPTAWVITL